MRGGFDLNRPPPYFSGGIKWLTDINYGKIVSIVLRANKSSGLALRAGDSQTWTVLNAGVPGIDFSDGVQSIRLPFPQIYQNQSKEK